MRVPAQCPHCRQVDERRQSMYEVSSGKRSRELDAVSLHEMTPRRRRRGELHLYNVGQDCTARKASNRLIVSSGRTFGRASARQRSSSGQTPIVSLGRTF
jgi:hypothetical protein